MSSTKHLAAALRADPAQISRWKARGMPTEVEQARSWHATYVRPRRRRNGAAPPTLVAAASPPAPTSDGDPPARTWADRRDRAAAKLRELELEEREGRLLDVARARKEFGDCWAGLVGLLQGFPPRTAHKLLHLDDAGITRALDEAIYELRMDFYEMFVARGGAGLMDEAVKAMAPPGRQK